MSANRVLLDALKTDPENPRALFDMAALEFRNKNYEAAEADLRRVWAIAPEEVAPVMVLSNVFESMGKEVQENERDCKGPVSSRDEEIERVSNVPSAKTPR